MTMIPIPAQKRRFAIKVGIRAFEPMVLGIDAYDPTREYTHYLIRKVPFRKKNFKKGEAYKEITLAFPVSPNLLMVKLYNKNDEDPNHGFEIEKLEKEPLPQSAFWATPDMHAFIDFAQGFCQKAGSLEPGFYHSPEDDFLIHYLPVITNQLGEVLITPARTHRVTGRHQVSQTLFRKLSIPVRMFIMLHERQHFVLPTREEKPADLAALRLYLDLGYPTIEAVYAATKVFRLHPETIGPGQVQRARDIIKFIDRYKQNQVA